MSLFERVRRDPEPDRRLWVRFPCDLFAGCYPAGNDTDFRWHARIRELSSAGLRLFVNLPVEQGTFLSVEFPATTLLAYVVRVSPHANNEWELGCVFSAELSSEDLQRFGAEPSRPEVDQTPGVIDLIYQAVQVHPLVWRPARGSDLSTTGITLDIQETLLLGSLLQLELAGGLMLAVVVQVTATDTGSRVGCSFVRELAEDELEALLAAR